LIINEHSGLCAFTFSDGGVQWPCDFTFPWEMWNQGGGQYSLVNIDSNTTAPHNETWSQFPVLVD
jgi:hypothetical protein